MVRGFPALAGRAAYWLYAVWVWQDEEENPERHGPVVSGIEQEPTVDEVKARIAVVEQLVSASVSIDEIALAIKAVHFGCTIQMAGLKRGDILFRARPVKERPTHRSMVSYPSAEKLKGRNLLGRANGVQQPMFYACTANRHHDRDHDNMIACLWESRAETGQVFAISRWQVAEDVPLYPFGFHVDAFLKSPFNQLSGRATDPVITGGSPRDALSLIQRWESAEFTRVVPPGSESLYKLTVAMTKYAIDFRWPVGSAGPGPHDRVSGIMYPSVANRLCVDNVCLRPEEADRVLTLLDVAILSPSEMREFDLAERSSVDDPIGMAQVRHLGSSLPCNGSHDIHWPVRAVLFPAFDAGNNTVSAGSHLRIWSGTRPPQTRIK
jgi:hypothetical protein